MTPIDGNAVTVRRWLDDGRVATVSIGCFRRVTVRAVTELLRWAPIIRAMTTPPIELEVDELPTRQRHFRVAVVTETYPPEVNGVARSGPGSEETHRRLVAEFAGEIGGIGVARP